MREPLVRSDYYGASAPSRTFNRRRIYPTVPNGFRARGTTRDGSRVHGESIDQSGAQLCPGSIATVTPQAFTVASPPTRQVGYGVSPFRERTVRCNPAHIQPCHQPDKITNRVTALALASIFLDGPPTESVDRFRAVG